MDWILPIGWTAFGALFVAIGVHSLRARRSFQRRADRALGQVTELRWHDIARGPGRVSTVAFPVLRFQTPDGRTLEVESLSGRNPAPARVGQQVTVLYDPHDPTQAALDGDAVSSVLFVGFIILGAFFMLSGLGMLLIAALVELALPGSP